MFSNLLDFIAAEHSIYQNVQCLIRSKNCVLNFTAVRYSLHKCSETILCQNDISPFTCRLFSCVSEFVAAKQQNLPSSSWDFNLVNFYSGEHSTKILSLRLLIRWSPEWRSVTLPRAISQDAMRMRRVPDRRLKRAQVAFMIHNNQRWLSILREFCRYNVVRKLIGIFSVVWFLWTYAKIFKQGDIRNATSYSRWRAEHVLNDFIRHHKQELYIFKSGPFLVHPVYKHAVDSSVDRLTEHRVAATSSQTDKTGAFCSKSPFIT